MADKRRFINQLPAFNQTEELKAFFSATIDHLFQPGSADSISGYVGRFPSYFDSTKDFYLQEPSDERQLHQLEATMVSRTDSAISRILFYKDFVNYLEARGGKTADESRLFRDVHYCWAPPIDLDKINNPHNYYWYGNDPSSQPTLILTAPFLSYVGDGTTTSFALPGALPGLTDNCFALVNTTSVACTEVGGNLILATAPAVGAAISVYRYGDIFDLISGEANFSTVGFTSLPVTSLTSGMRIALVDAINQVTGFDGAALDAMPWDQTVTNAFIVNGVGSSIILTPVNDEASLDPVYMVIDRTSIDDNPWAKNNFWVHADALVWSGEALPASVATRPIIEFNPSIRLYNYGQTRSPGVNCILSSTASTSRGWGVLQYDVDPIDYTVALTADAIIGQPVGTVTVDDLHVLQVGDRLLIKTDVTAAPQLSQAVVIVTSQTVNGAAVYDFNLDSTITAGSLVAVQDSSSEYFFDGAAWQLAQPFVANTPPLFRLYDGSGVAVDDSTTYPGSTFAGSRIFGFSEDGSGAADSILGVALVYDDYGQIVFENDLVTRRISYASGEITGYYYFAYATPNADTFSNNWHYSASNLSQQTVIGVESEDNSLIYSIPSNLESNPDFADIDFISLSQWFDHFNSIMSNQIGFSGVPYSTNNWRDTQKNLNLGTKILQHRSPLLRAMLLASDTTFDYLDSVRFVDLEYSRFRSRFLQCVLQIQRTGELTEFDDPQTWVDTVLTSLKATKTNDFSFSLSAMAGGEYFIPPTPASMGLQPCSTPGIVQDNTYGLKLNFLQGHDGSRVLLKGEQISFVYNGGPAQFVLSTEPLGSVMVYVNGVPLSTGSYALDGRLITLATPPATNAVVSARVSDIRDIVLLALEQRIYENIDPSFKTEALLPFNMFSLVESKYRPVQAGTNYSISEFNDLVSPIFIKWAQMSKLDPRANTIFDENDAFTWNYSSSLDRDGNAVPGFWRGIYRWYFDTDRPHLAPWEMLGFSDEPVWWSTVYGPAPYSSFYTEMWSDISQGVIRQGARAGTDVRFARPNLLEILPVDALGRIMDPVSAGIIPQSPTAAMASQSWEPGDCAPVETLWRNTSTYSFALCQISYLMRPASFIESGWDTTNFIYDVADQKVDARTGVRPPAASYYVHGEIGSDGSRISLLGVQQWISERMISLGQDASTFGDAVRGLSVQLAHKMAGFTSASDLRVQADNFGLLPAEDITSLLYQSPSIRQVSYSGVLLEWTGRSWKCLGYDSIEPYFTVLPGEITGATATISLDNGPSLVINDWKPNVYYKAGMLVSYNGSVYECSTAHTSSTTFEQVYWTARPGIALSQGARVVDYLDVTGETSTVPYGTELFSQQQVADLLLGYQRFLVSQGFVFNETTFRDSVKDFLAWSQINWKEGNFIALSPFAEGISFSTQQGFIGDLDDLSTGAYSIVDRSGLPINRRDLLATRVDGDFSLTATGAQIFGVRLNIGEVEHALVFSNQTIFGDVIYVPLFSLRQPRLRIIGERTTNWSGRLDAPGYIITDGDVMSNFQKSTEDLRTMFDIERSNNADLRDQARAQIGFQSRSYLTDLLISDTEQFEFYQGMIHQKGAPGVFSKMLRSLYVGQDRNLEFLEEWAFKVGEFGGTNVFQTVAFDLAQSDLLRNPQFIEFSSDSSTPDRLTVSGSSLVSPVGATPFPLRASFASLPGDLPTSGYARLTEVDYTVIDDASIPQLFLELAAQGSSLIAGDCIWVYNTTDSWKVEKAYWASTTNTSNIIAQVITGNGLGAKINMTSPHGLTSMNDVGRQVVINGLTRSVSDLQGVHTITAVTSPTSFTIDADCSVSYFWVTDGVTAAQATDPSNAPGVLVLKNIRFSTPAAMTAATWLLPVDHDLIYVDQATAGGWVVMRYLSGSWSTYRQQPIRVDGGKIDRVSIYDLSTSISSTELSAEPLILDGILTLAPHIGLISGVAEREITYMLEYDPACYNAGLSVGGVTWGADYVGQLWWDVSTVRYLDPETDILTSGDPSRTTAEIAYRTANWATMAPGTSVDVYEWTRSTVEPSQTGLDLYESGESWSTVQEFDATLNRLVTAYYFWVRNPTELPVGNTERQTTASTVSSILASPTSQDIAWVAPVASDSLIVSGVAPYLNDTSTVLQLNVRAQAYDGPAHTEWALLRSGDEFSGPTDMLWDRLTDSLAGVNVLNQPVPDPTLHVSMRQGIEVRPRQSLFADDDIKGSMLAARQAFIEIVNLIFARTNIVQDRVDIVESLTKVQTINDVNLWTTDFPDYVSPPTSAEYDLRVTSQFELKQSLLRPEVRTGSTKKRVLLDQTAEDFPQWSVWVYDPSLDTFGTNDVSRLAASDTLFRLAPAYDYQVATLAARDALSPPTGSLVYVSATPQTGSMWSLWKWNGVQYSLVRWQDYDLTAFWSYTDWYATGYSAASPPTTVYANASARNSALNPHPSITLVKILDDGTGAWAWTAYNATTTLWDTVAHQNGTIAFSSAFYDATRSVYGLDPSTFALAANRDGTLEMRELLATLKNEILVASEINEVFFSMVNFAHTYLDVVNWAFKTSFLYITGYNEPLTQAPIETSDNTDELLAYIEEVKPYRVKTRAFTRLLTPDLEQANTTVSDFDKPIYYDTTSKSYRVLNVNNPGDLAILQTAAYSGWYNNYTKTGTDLQNYDADTWNPIRRFVSTLVFDRIDGVHGLLDGAAGRILNGYQFQPGETLQTLLGSGNPEEFASVSPQERVMFKITSDGFGGALPQTVKYYNTASAATSTVALAFGVVAQSNEGVAIFRDGVRATYGVDYTLDLFRMTASVNVSGISLIAIHVFGTGANTSLLEQRYCVTSPGVRGFTTSRQGVNEVFINGTQASFSNVGGLINIDAATPDGSQVMINTFSAGALPTHVKVQDLSYVASGSQQINFPCDPNSPADHDGTIVEVDGIRLRPPQSNVYVFSYTNRVLQLRAAPDPNRVTVYIGGTKYQQTITVSNEATLAAVLAKPQGTYPGSFVFWKNYLVCTDSSIHGYVVNMVDYENNEYSISNGLLTLVTPTSASQKVKVTTFIFSGQMGLESFTLPGSTDGFYVVPDTSTADCIWVNLNGKYVVGGVHFSLVAGGIQFSSGQQSSDWVIITVFKGAPASNGRILKLTSDSPASDLFTANIDALGNPVALARLSQRGDWDEVTFDVGGFDQVLDPTVISGGVLPINVVSGDWDFVPYDSEGLDLGTEVTLQSTGGYPTYQLGKGWEFFEISDDNKGTLQTALGANDSTIVVTYAPTSSAVYPTLPFPQPGSDVPGAIWIGPERIEFKTATYSGNTVVLGGLSRGTRGTPVGKENRFIGQFPADGSTTTFKIAGSPTVNNVFVSIYGLDGSIVENARDYNYTTRVDSTGVYVTFNSAPAFGEVVILSQTAAVNVHMQNAQVACVKNLLVQPANLPI